MPDSAAPAMPITTPPSMHGIGGPWDMVMGADPLVQCVMAVLLAASVATWTILLVKGAEVLIARRRASRALRIAATADGLATMAGDGIGPSRLLIEAARDEMRRSVDLPPEGIKDRIALRLRRIEAGLTRRMGRGTGLLASIGAVAPFVGLFGTVWGIMDSFIGISHSKTTSLAVVAPGIAEALLATAFGLAAAIPAVLVYNAFARLMVGYRAELGDLSALIQASAAREIDGKAITPRPAARPVPLRQAAE